jgi:dipeptidyl aminopeptidase/acylaminoacyl peptidase
MRVAPFGTWASPITGSVVAAQGLRLGFVAIDGDDVFWLEGRPEEGGRTVLVRWTADGTILDVTPPGLNVRSRVQEYAGGAYILAGRTVFFSNFLDQRVYRQRIDRTGEEGLAEAITPAGAWFYADYEVDRARQRLICVREDHTVEGREAVTTLVSVPTFGSSRDRPEVLAAGDVIASGYDFYSTPRLSPDGSMLCWICWRHPNMPWDGTELWVADVTGSGALANHRQIAGGDTESIYQPGWSPDGTLHFVSDRTGFWQIYRADATASSSNSALVSRDPKVANAEFGRPQWQFGSASWACADPSRLVVTYTQGGRWRLATLDVASGHITDVPTTIEPSEWLAATPHTALLVGGSPSMPQSVVTIDLATGRAEVLRSSSSVTFDSGYISAAEAIEPPTAGGLTAHAFFYPPRNRDFVAPPGELPPLIVISHGGPTTAARATFDLQIQFWTSRGFGVVDVNYGGSSGYGRAYRRRLNGQWGIVDVADCVNTALFLADSGRVDRSRLAIRGGSAGGYTTLAALTFHPDVFKAGASYYGVSDIEVLARDTHKFESRYLDSLVGPYPEAQDLYRARSPIHFVDRLSCPLILLQGREDKVVPPNQAEMMADAVRSKGLPVALMMFEGEQHGFRRAETIVRSLEAELYFYGVVFGFTPADRIEPIEIANV